MQHPTSARQVFGHGTPQLSVHAVAASLEKKYEVSSFVKCTTETYSNISVYARLFFFNIFVKTQQAENSQNFKTQPKFLPKLANFCSKLSFPAKISNFYYIRVFEKLTVRLKTRPNFKTQAPNFPKTQFSGNSSCSPCRTIVEKKPGVSTT